jgi:hypothetical protein
MGFSLCPLFVEMKKEEAERRERGGWVVVDAVVQR